MSGHTNEQLESAVRGLGLRAGDIILSGARDPISSVIQHAIQSPVSHSILVVSEERCVEGHDGIHEFRRQFMTLGEETPGVHETNISRICASSDIDYLVVRRPANPVDADRLLESVNRYLRHRPGFGTAALILMGLTRIITAIPNPFRQGLGSNSDGWDVAVAHLARRLADGNETIICSELVHRCLAEAGAAPTYQALLLDHAFRLGVADESFLDRTEPGSGLDTVPPPNDLSTFGSVVGWLSNGGPGLIDALRDRGRTQGTGDIADFVTPADLHRSPSFTTLIELNRVGGSWWALHIAEGSVDSF